MEGKDDEGKVEKKRGAERREGRRHLSVIERSTVGTLSTVYLTHNLEYYVQEKTPLDKELKVRIWNSGNLY